MSDPQTMLLPNEEEKWPGVFKAARLDVVPDPMVMRVADLFVGGKDFAVNKAKLNADKVWKAISENLDALIAFFHILMTRDKIPLIDYEFTFQENNFRDLAYEIVLLLHPPNYGALRDKAKETLSKIDFTRIPYRRRAKLFARQRDEFEAIGYQWFPDPGEQFTEDDRLLAIYLLGGLIFGGYAQISGSDHLLQDTRSELLLELTLQDTRSELLLELAKADEKQRLAKEKEAELFSHLKTLINKDQRLSLHETPLPPTILPYLLKQKPRSPRHLFDTALDLREKDPNFVSYRAWHRQLREAWANGTHNEAAEKAVAEVTTELAKRFPPGKERDDTTPLWSRDIDIKATVGAQAGIKAGVEHEIGEGKKLVGHVEAVTKAEIEADVGKVSVSFPDWIRNLLLEGFKFRRHRKVLLKMALAEHSTFDLTEGLRKLWWAELE